MLKEKFKTLKSANEYFNILINSYKKDEEIKNNDIIQLLQYYPNKNININNIEWIKNKIRKPFNNLSLYYKCYNEEEENISWKICIRNMLGKYEIDKEKIQDIKIAFRFESHYGTKKDYFNINNNKICSNCNINKNIAVDHYPIPYIKIFNDFIKDNNIDINNIEIFKNDNNELRLKNRNIANDFLNYHDNIASYRYLCNKCNSSFGNYGF